MDDSALYTQLDASANEIRLLTIHPAHGKNSDVVHCTLRKASLSDNEVYVALSYCWGQPDATEAVMVNNQTLRVTTNLEAALRQLRETLSEASDMNFWIDALCIDQSNILEKNHQVPLMRDIYRDAKAAIVWLGVSDEAVDTFADATRDLPPLQPGQARACDKSNQELAFLVCLAGRVLSRPWWQRIWVIQEFVLPATAPHFLCGPHMWTWNDLNHCLSWPFIMARNAMSDTQLSDHVVEAWRQHPKMKVHDQQQGDSWKEWVHRERALWKEIWHMVTKVIGLEALRDSTHAGKHLSLLAALMYTQKSLVTDPRDRIFGLMGLLSESERSKIVVDYAPPAHQISHQIIRKLWHEWDLMTSLEQFLPVSNPSTPSWVPDLSTSWAFNAVGAGDDEDEPVWVTKTKIEPPRNWEQKECIFWLGTSLDVITWSETITSDGPSHPGTFVASLRSIREAFTTASAITIPPADALRQLEPLKHRHPLSKIMVRMSPSYNNDAETERSLAQYLTESWITDSVPIISPGRALSDTVMAFIVHNVLSPAECPGNNDQSVGEALAKFRCVSEFILLACKKSPGYSFFVTSHGFLGFARVRPNKDDRVVLLQGMRYPMILRPQEGDSFRLVSLAFVSGVMDLKEMETFRDGGILADQEFKII